MRFLKSLSAGIFVFFCVQSAFADTVFVRHGVVSASEQSKVRIIRPQIWENKAAKSKIKVLPKKLQSLPIITHKETSKQLVKRPVRLQVIYRPGVSSSGEASSFRRFPADTSKPTGKRYSTNTRSY